MQRLGPIKPIKILRCPAKSAACCSVDGMMNSSASYGVLQAPITDLRTAKPPYFEVSNNRSACLTEFKWQQKWPRKSEQRDKWKLWA